MTAEEMLEKSCIAYDAGEYAIDCDKAHACMEEYATQQSVAFAEFTVTWDIHISQNRDFQWKSKLPSIYGERLRTTAELYAEFVKDQTPKSL